MKSTYVVAAAIVALAIIIGGVFAYSALQTPAASPSPTTTATPTNSPLVTNTATSTNTPTTTATPTSTPISTSTVTPGPANIIGA
jgi:hypothetical protein